MIDKNIKVPSSVMLIMAAQLYADYFNRLERFGSITGLIDKEVTELMLKDVWWRDADSIVEFLNIDYQDVVDTIGYYASMPLPARMTNEISHTMREKGGIIVEYKTKED